MQKRYHGLDALRAVAMLMGIVIHGALIYSEPGIVANVVPKVEVPPLPDRWTVLIMWIHQWRMPVFFLLAGFFGAMVIEKRGPLFFLKDRALRIGLTLGLLLVALTPVVKDHWGDLHHFWFLWFLVQFYALALLGQALGLGRLFAPLVWIYKRPSRMLLLYLPMVPLVVFTKHELLGQIIPDHLFDVRWQGLVYYAFFFFAGMLLWPGRAVLESLGRARVWGGLLAGSMVAAVIVTVIGLAEIPADLAMIALIPAGQMALIFGIIGMAHGLITSGGPVIRFLVDSSYAVYIVHLYVVVSAGIALLMAGFSTDMVIVLSILITAPVSLLFYVIFVRYTPLDWLLAGPRNARFRWPFYLRTAPPKT